MRKLIDRLVNCVCCGGLHLDLRYLCSNHVYCQCSGNEPRWTTRGRRMKDHHKPNLRPLRKPR